MTAILLTLPAMCADRILLYDPDKLVDQLLQKILGSEFKLVWYGNIDDLHSADLALMKTAIIGITDEEHPSWLTAMERTRELYGMPVIITATAKQLLTINKNLKPGFEAIIKKPSTIEMISQTVRLIVAAEENLEATSARNVPEEYSTVSLSFADLEKVARDFPTTVLIPDENYYVVSDRDKVEELTTPTIVKSRPMRLDRTTVERITRAQGKKYGGIVDSRKKPADSIVFRREDFFCAFLVNNFKKEFAALKDSAGDSSLVKEFSSRMEDEDFNMADRIMDDLFKNLDVVNHFFDLRRFNSESAFRAVSRHIVHSSFTTVLFTIKYLREVHPQCFIEKYASIAGLAAMMKEYGAERLFTSHTVGSMEFVREWSSRVASGYEQIRQMKTMNSARYIYKAQHSLTLGLPVFRFGLYTRLMQMAATLDIITSGYGAIKIGPYTESFREGSSLLNACYNMIVHSRKPRHSKDYEHVYDEALVEFIFKSLGFSDALNYQKLIADVRNNRCGKVIISPNEIQPVTAVCPFTEGGKLHECSGCSVKVNAEYRGEQYRTCVPAHKEITQINSDFFDKKTH